MTQRYSGVWICPVAHLDPFNVAMTLYQGFDGEALLSSTPAGVGLCPADAPTNWEDPEWTPTFTHYAGADEVTAQQRIDLTAFAEYVENNLTTGWPRNGANGSTGITHQQAIDAAAAATFSILAPPAWTPNVPTQNFQGAMAAHSPPLTSPQPPEPEE